MKTLELFPAQEQNEQLVTVNNGQAVTASLQVAEYFGKTHKDVLKSIRALECSSLFRAGNFPLFCYSRKKKTPNFACLENYVPLRRYSLHTASQESNANWDERKYSVSHNPFIYP